MTENYSSTDIQFPLTFSIPIGIIFYVNENQLIILQTACLLFSQNGYDGVGVQEIVEKAGFSKPTLYHYFRSKQGLLEAVLEHYLQPFEKQLMEKMVYQGDLQTSLREILDIYLEFAHINSRFFRLWMTLRLSPPQSTPYQAILPYVRKHQAALLHFFQNVSLQHGNMREREQILATSFMGLVFNFAMLSLQDEFNFNQPRKYQIIHQYMHGIFS